MPVLVLVAALAVERQRHLDLRLGGPPVDHRAAHRASRASTALRVCSTTPVVRRKQFGHDGSFVRSRTNTPLAIMPSTSARARSPPSIRTKFAALFQ